MKVITLSDRQIESAMSIFRRYFFEAKNRGESKEAAKADELYLVVSNAPWELDQGDDISTSPDWEPGLFRFAPPEAREEA